MPSIAVCSRGLVFPMLILQLTSAKAAIPFVGVPDDNSDGCDDCLTSHGMMHRITSTSSRSSASPISSASHATPASSRSTVTANVAHRAKFSTAAIVGATLGSLIVVGLLLMLLAKYLNRARKARKRPVGFVPVFPNLSPPAQTNARDTEMSQSQPQSNPLISAAAARAITDPTPPYSHSFYGENKRTNLPLSCLASPIVPLRHSVIVDASSPSNEHTSDDASSSHEPLQSPYETSSNNANPPLWAVGGYNTGFFPSSSFPEPSGVHREMAVFQKALETGEKGRDAQFTQQAAQLEMRGPPPKYNG